MRPNKPSLNYGRNNINTINKQCERRSDFKPRFQFNRRRFNPYSRQQRPMYTTNPRPFTLNNNWIYAHRRNNFYQNNSFKRSLNVRFEDRNNSPSNQNNNAQYWNSNNNSNFNRSPRSNIIGFNQRLSTRRGSRSNSIRPLGRRDNNRSTLHQIDSNINDASQDWLEKEAPQVNNTNCIILNTDYVTFKACLDSGNNLKFPVISLVLLEKLQNSGQIPKFIKL